MNNKIVGITRVWNESLIIVSRPMSNKLPISNKFWKGVYYALLIQFVVIAFIAICVTLISDAKACTLGEFDYSVPTVIPTSDVASIEGDCVLQVDGSGWVNSDVPNFERRIYGRFYIYPGPGIYKILIAVDAGNEVFNLTYTDGFIRFDAAGILGGMASVSTKPGQWNLVQFLWESDELGGLWVNTDARKRKPQATFYSGMGKVESFDFGVIGGTTDTAYFDAILLHRHTHPGPYKRKGLKRKGAR